MGDAVVTRVSCGRNGAVKFPTTVEPIDHKEECQARVAHILGTLGGDHRGEGRDSETRNRPASTAAEERAGNRELRRMGLILWGP